TLATITFQNYFRMYKKLSGMTGTAKTEEEEFRGIYKLDVVTIPTNRPMIRKDLNDQVYTTLKGKFKRVLDEIEERHKTGQPILVGTVSVEISETLSKLLSMRGIEHEVLNAKYHEKEAEIVAQAGHFGAVTIATNMAGRGTDILLGGNPEYLARRAMRQRGYEDDVIEDATGFNEDVPEIVLEARAVYHELYTEFKKKTDEEHDRVVAVGGLHIIGTERHESRRIDNQLRGRSGRQGDPGSSQFFLSMQDDLLRLFGSDKLSGIVSKLGVQEDEVIEANILTNQIESAQKRIEARNYEIRKTVLQYDDVMNQQRQEIYGQRKQVLEGNDMHETILKMADMLVDEAMTTFCSDGDIAMDWDMDGLRSYLELLCIRRGFFAAHAEPFRTISKEALTAALKQEVRDFDAAREEALTALHLDVREIERVILLRSVDERWMDHIDAMDQLRDGIGLRAFANKNPVTEYQIEGYDMFDEMVHLIREDTIRKLFQSRFTVQQERRAVVTAQETNLEQAKNAGGPTGPRKVGKKVGRNDPCPCGSGKKYKNCCGKGA
ncbi:MAG: SEC-C domain-containing protein, partial [Clostridia bacterium]|nr:SEC-C domain-containing protein [Clostridia bacterium]